ncbi:Alpha-1,3-arabinosyltransferase XAT2 [Sesamum alatum]|uniref:Alpha-1,3-arabinosyltransferase XAT2 n=1 Tax=Sesamum alatum TaxID=300844 RepID=A0AAE1XLR9_9LAMI|nr:Alpha-1,3-arabinosyltransferase XAT2 [Sesamum alatum]
MYDPIFAKSFNQYERKRFGCCALVLFFITALSISSAFNSHLQSASVIGDAVNLQLTINAVDDMGIIDDTSEEYEERGGNAAVGDLQINATESSMLVVNDTSLISQLLAINETRKAVTFRRISGYSNANYYAVEGDIRIEANSSTIFVVKPLDMSISSSNQTSSWSIQPYPRKGLSSVKNWTVNIVRHNNDNYNNIPKCTQNHRRPAILFSVAGFSGNYFHDFADLLFPLYSTSFRFKKEVHFLASDYKPWWISKYRRILDLLTRHEVVDIDNEKLHVHCYNNMVAGLNFHKELMIDPLLSEPPSGLSMRHFKQLLRRAYSLERKRAVRSRKGDGTKKPRLMIISRNRTRVLTNEVDLSRLARELGYEVVSAEARLSTNVTTFAQTVNSCDVLMGVHGAGLTNMVFLPDNGVLIQVVPFGDIDKFARLDFENPSAGMNIRYLEYKVSAKESSLSRQYPTDHPVLRDPKSYSRRGWYSMSSIYLEKQNVTIDLDRFRGTLAKALKLLRH